MKVDIVAFGAHPDDVELGCAGSILSAIATGKSVGIVDLTQGELGTRGSAAIRKEEATNAAYILGVSFRKNLGFRDGFFVNDKKHQMELIKMIRKYRPEIVLCNAIDDRHIDHEKGSKLVSDASFLYGLMKIENEKRLNIKMVLPNEYDWDEQIQILNKKISTKIFMSTFLDAKIKMF